MLKAPLGAFDYSRQDYVIESLTAIHHECIENRRGTVRHRRSADTVHVRDCRPAPCLSDRANFGARGRIDRDAAPVDCSAVRRPCRTVILHVLRSARRVHRECL